MKTLDAAKIPHIGWREWISLPDLGVDKIKVKIDTGARTSSLHAFRIKIVTIDGRHHAKFFVHPVQHKKLPEIACCAPIVDEREVTSSNGQKQMRYVVQTPVSLGPYTWPVEITLTNRDEMGFRMLLGREAMRGRFLVDPGASFVFESQRP